MSFIVIHNLVDPNDPQGRTYKQINEAKTHSFKIGSLVEIEETGIRLFVVHQGRDCDGTPLYWLSDDAEDTEAEHDGFKNRGWVGGYSEDGMKLIREPKAEAAR